MAKSKKVLKRTIPTDLIPIKDETWLIQPLAVTSMRHDFSKTQIKVLVSLIEKLQYKIHEKMSNPNRDLFSSEDFDDDGKIPIQLYYKDLGVADSNYSTLETSLKDLGHIPVEIITKGKDNSRNWIKSTNLCDVYLMEKVKYNKYAVIKISPDIADRLISLKFGYHSIGKEVVFNAHNKYTQRIYMILEAWKKQGWCRLNMLELRKSLRLEHKYPSYYDFEKRVLKPAKKELKETCDDGFCDCYFDYTPEYERGQKKSEYPPTLFFKITVIQSDIDKQLQDVVAGYQDNFAHLLKKHFKFTESKALRLSAHITNDNYSSSIRKMTELKQYVDSHLNEITDVIGYVYKSFLNHFGVTELEDAQIMEIKNPD